MGGKKASTRGDFLRLFAISISRYRGAKAVDSRWIPLSSPLRKSRGNDAVTLEEEKKEETGRSERDRIKRREREREMEKRGREM